MDGDSTAPQIRRWATALADTDLVTRKSLLEEVAAGTALSWACTQEAEGDRQGWNSAPSQHLCYSGKQGKDSNLISLKDFILLDEHI